MNTGPNEIYVGAKATLKGILTPRDPGCYSTKAQRAEKKAKRQAAQKMRRKQRAK